MTNAVYRCWCFDGARVGGGRRVEKGVGSRVPKDVLDVVLKRWWVWVRVGLWR